MGLSTSPKVLLNPLVEGQGSGLCLVGQRVDGWYLYVVLLQALLFKIPGWVDWRDYEVWTRNLWVSFQLLRQTIILSVYVEGEVLHIEISGFNGYCSSEAFSPLRPIAR